MPIKKLLLSIALAATLANPVLAQEKEQTAITKADVLKKTLRIITATGKTAVAPFIIKLIIIDKYKNHEIDRPFARVASLTCWYVFAEGLYEMRQELKPIAKYVYKKVKAEKPEQLQEQAA